MGFPFLYGKPLSVVTDDCLLFWSESPRNTSGRLARCRLRLQEDDIIVSYKSRRKHGEADCLFRAPVESALAIYDDDEVFLDAVDGALMERMQRTDPELRAVLDMLEDQAGEFPDV